jgi:hypothetical protein
MIDYIILVLLFVLALCVMLQKPLHVVITHRIKDDNPKPDLPAVDPAVEQTARIEVSKAIQEALGVFSDDDK